MKKATNPKAKAKSISAVPKKQVSKKNIKLGTDQTSTWTSDAFDAIEF